MEIHGGMVMRCLIPINQEMRNENAMRRASVLCDDVHVLYMLDESLLDRMERESAYVLNSDMLDVLKKTLIDSQRKEAESMISGMDGASLHFEVGDTYELIDRYALRLMPDMIMVDDFDRKLMGLKTALWIDRGNTISSCIFVVDSVQHLTRLKEDINFLNTLSKRLSCEFSIYAASGKKDDEKVLSSFGLIVHSPGADLTIYQKKPERIARNDSFMVLRV